MEVKRTRPSVSLEQLGLERIEFEWMRMNSPSIVRTRIVRRRGGKLLISENGTDKVVHN